MNHKKKIAIIGAGAAGLVAAITAARAGADVTVYEKHARAGKKILATGNGRCNVSNTDLSLSHYHGKEPRFARFALEVFGFEACREFFESLGLVYKVAPNGRAYPFSMQAASVVDVLMYELESLGARILFDAPVKTVTRGKTGLALKAGEVGGTFDAVLIATGGKAAPGLASDGEGYALAKPFGHNVAVPFPSLVQLKLEASFLKRISGVKVEGVVTLQDQSGRTIQEADGDILFTDYGISGNAVLDISRKAAERVLAGETVSVSIDSFPTMENKVLDELLQKRFTLQPKKEGVASLIGLVNKKLAAVLVEDAGIASDKNVANYSKQERKALVTRMKSWTFRVTGTQDWKRAEVTAGGIETKAVDPETMESKLQKGLYFAGEVLDIDGDCGGYNLHWAWASGYLAGRSMV
jgi:predicted Rossmann fold flavoprotein